MTIISLKNLILLGIFQIEQIKHLVCIVLAVTGLLTPMEKTIIKDSKIDGA